MTGLGSPGKPGPTTERCTSKQPCGDAGPCRRPVERAGRPEGEGRRRRNLLREGGRALRVGGRAGGREGG